MRLNSNVFQANIKLIKEYQLLRLDLTKMLKLKKNISRELEMFTLENFSPCSENWDKLKRNKRKMQERLKINNKAHFSLTKTDLTLLMVK
ncbi:hypothetical protein [Liquorilactobacillus hordei]|uniref:hypothetical protein n=1 Tax=Liquorilactobacillus hordei TaxID=468911 RepID=UPI001CBD46E9|nr:hypothetical protein [Liquorilactobacillus hordei]MBZ2406675.1 hypothetical protein [Liquorilactobacillus hordei]